MGQNKLYPIFLKLENLQTLLVGAGNVGLEKLTAFLNNSPEANVTIVADQVCDEVAAIVESNPNIKLLKRNLKLHRTYYSVSLQPVRPIKSGAVT